MWRVLPLLLLVGCKNCLHQTPCAPATACPAPETTTTIKAPAPKVEVQAAETIVVKAPAPKVVMEQPQDECVNANGAVCGKRGCAPQQQCYNPYSQPMYYQQPMVYGGVPMMQQGFGGVPMMQQGFGGVPMMGGEIKERTAFGLMFDSVKIPIPWLRLKAIPQSPEVTFKGQMAPQGFGGVPMMQQGFGGVPMMPQGFGGVPMMQQGFGGVPTGGQMVVTGSQMVPVTGTMPVQVPAGNNGVAGAAGFGGVAATDSTSDTVSINSSENSKNAKTCRRS